MIYIDRGVDEAVWVGETVVRILEVDGDEVRIAISSPDSPRYQEVVLRVGSACEENVPRFERSGESLSFFA